MELEERLDFIEFRMNLLREGTNFSKYIYDCGLTRTQLKALYDIMNEFRKKINNSEDVDSNQYESEVLEVVDNRKLDYHFCESFAELLWEDQSYEEVFSTLYRDSIKFQHHFK